MLRDDLLDNRGSRDIVRGFGRGRWAMSIVSIRESFVVHVVVGEIVVGRVIVDDTAYNMEPFSNCDRFTAPGVSFPAHMFVSLRIASGSCSLFFFFFCG